MASSNLNQETHTCTFYLSLFQQIRGWMDTRKSAVYPFFVGINGPQGCGKTTLCEALVKQLLESGFHATHLSIDDFYLTHAEQKKLARKYSGNALLAQRGFPGTHDIDLGTTTLSTLKNIYTTGEVRCPVYDKSAHRGEGDRAAEWQSVRAPVDVILFEGWMLGFSPVLETVLPSSEFHTINLFLKKYQAWTLFLNAFIHLEPQKIDFISSWRIEAEEKRKASGKEGMSAQQISEYIAKFIPAYHLYLPQLRAFPPPTSHFLHVLLSENRLPVTL